MKKLKDFVETYNPADKGFIKPYIIAEAGVNHEGNIDLAKRLIEEAVEGGADAIKFQTYKADKIASKNSPSYWDLTKESTDSQYKLFKKYDAFWKSEFEELKTCCVKNDIEFLSTPFDIESAKFLNDLMDVFKISSSDLNNKPFIDNICSYNKPIILSTGASYLNEVKDTVDWIENHGNVFCLLHCILNYPTEDKNANLLMISELINQFPENIIGYSDHTFPKDMKTLEVAFLLGAKILEKHFTFDKSLPGNDHYHAMDKEDLKRFNDRLKYLEELLGNGEKIPLVSEELSRKNARRSLVSSRFIPKGKVVDKDDITWKRPASGIDPREYDKLIGCIAIQNVEEDSVLNWELFIEK